MSPLCPSCGAEFCNSSGARAFYACGSYFKGASKHTSDLCDTRRELAEANEYARKLNLKITDLCAERDRSKAQVIKLEESQRKLVTQRDRACMAADFKLELRHELEALCGTSDPKAAVSFIKELILARDGYKAIVARLKPKMQPAKIGTFGGLVVRLPRGKQPFVLIASRADREVIAKAAGKELKP